MSKILDIETWITQKDGKQFSVLSRETMSIHKRIDSVLRFKDKKVFKRYENLFSLEFTLSNIRFAYIIRIDEFNEDCIHVILMDGVWDITNYLWVEELLMEEKIKINDIQNYINDWSINCETEKIMSTILDKHLRFVKELNKKMIE